MSDPVNRQAPPDLVDALNASLRDLASGAVSDAASVQLEARRRLAGHDGTHPSTVSEAGRTAKSA